MSLQVVIPLASLYINVAFSPEGTSLGVQFQRYLCNHIMVYYGTVGHNCRAYIPTCGGEATMNIPFFISPLCMSPSDLHVTVSGYPNSQTHPRILLCAVDLPFDLTYFSYEPPKWIDRKLTHGVWGWYWILGGKDWLHNRWILLHV